MAKLRLRHERVRRLLLVGLGGAGDLLLATPFLREARRRFARAWITLLAVDRSIGLLAGNPNLDEIVAIPGTAPGAALRHPVAHLAPLLALRRRRFDLAVNLLPLASPGGAFRMRLLLALLGARATAGLDTERRGGFLDLRVPDRDAKTRSAVDLTLALAAALGGRADVRHPELFVAPAARDRADALLAGCRGRLVAVNPGATRAAFRWPAERFAETIRRLAATRPDLTFLLTGLANERPVADEVAARAALPPGRLVNLAGATDLPTLAALLARVALFLTNDTGALHVGAACDAPLVAIFGPGDRVRFAPVTRSGRVRVLHEPPPCAPCMRETCDRMDCMTAIPTDAVVAAAEALLESGAA